MQPNSQVQLRCFSLRAARMPLLSTQSLHSYILDTPPSCGDSGSSYILNTPPHLAIPSQHISRKHAQSFGDSSSSYILNTPPPLATPVHRVS